MADSEASKILTILQAELGGAKTQWEYLDDRITNGYKDAYKLHVGALTEMKNARLLAEQKEAMFLGIEMFVLSVVSVGFAGGLVGGVIAPWVREAEKVGANTAIRQAVQGIAQRTTQQAVLRLVPERPEPPAQSSYDPVSPDAFDSYLDTKEELDGCFARVNAHLQKVKDLSNREQWPAEEGQTILDSYRRYCRLLSEAPDPDKPSDLPAKSDVARAAELAMWVAWANARDWDWWNKVYEKIDDLSTRAKRREGGHTWPVHSDEMKSALELNPILTRLNWLGVGLLVQKDTGTYFGGRISSTDKIVDLRKLRTLRLQHLPDLPFAGMDNLDFGWIKSNRQLSGFLDGLHDLRPFHIAAAAPQKAAAPQRAPAPQRAAAP